MVSSEPFMFTDPRSTDIGVAANSPILWVFVIGVFAVIFVQTFLYVRAVRAAAQGIEMPIREIKESYRAGAVASIGPSLAVALVAIALLTLFGTPAVLVRIGLIGSAATETASAGIAASSMGAELGADTYTQQVFAVAFIAMSLSGGMWMLCTLLLTPILKRGTQALGKRNPAVMVVVPAAALLGAFSMLTVAETGKSSLHLVIVLISACMMGGCIFIAKLLRVKWLKEWALGFSVLVSLLVAYLLYMSAAA